MGLARGSSWLAATLVAVGVHVAGGVWFLRPDERPSPIPPGEGGVVLQLASIGGRAGTDVPQATEVAGEAGDLDEPDEPEPVVEAERVVEPEPPAVVEPEPEPLPEPEPEPVPVVAPAPAAAPGTETVEGDALPEGGAPGSAASAASDTPSDAGGDPQAALEYKTELQLWLQQHKRYPRRLKRRRVEGEVVVAFTVDAGGRLLDHRIVRSSGEPGLDEAAIDLLVDADPMPAIPSSMGLARYTAELPVRYALD